MTQIDLFCFQDDRHVQITSSQSNRYSSSSTIKYKALRAKVFELSSQLMSVIPKTPF